jgi:hypothetical protein
MKRLALISFLLFPILVLAKNDPALPNLRLPAWSGNSHPAQEPVRR